jgi:hypothetical protein
MVLLAKLDPDAELSDLVFSDLVRPLVAETMVERICVLPDAVEIVADQLGIPTEMVEHAIDDED